MLGPHFESRQVQIENCLVLATRCLVRFDGCPRLSEPWSVKLSHVTQRGGTAVVIFNYSEMADEPGGYHPDGV